jgi:hypothetical protein
MFEISMALILAVNLARWALLSPKKFSVWYVAALTHPPFT